LYPLVGIDIYQYISLTKITKRRARMLKSMERIWARATGHLIGNTDQDKPDVPILTLREASVALYLKTFWVVIHVVTCLFIITNIIRHW
jgi:hypothetical protein